MGIILKIKVNKINNLTFYKVKNSKIIFNAIEAPDLSIAREILNASVIFNDRFRN